MSELLILFASALGIGAMVLINSRLDIWTPAVIASLGDAQRRLDADSVGFEAGEGILAEDGKSALVEEAGTDRIALLVARGDNVVIRYLDAGAVKAARVDADGALTVRLDDFTFAPARLDLADAHEARLWADKLNALQD